jgi:hypothetical protein
MMNNEGKTTPATTRAIFPDESVPGKLGEALAKERKVFWMADIQTCFFDEGSQLS